MSKYYSETHTGSPQRHSFNHHSSYTNVPRTTSLAEVRDLVREHVQLNPQWEKARKSETELGSIKNKRLKKFYVRQNELLDYYQEVDELLSETTGAVAHTLAREGDPLLPISRESTEQKAIEQRRQDKIAINVNFAVNVALLLLKILVVVLSNSLSLLASAVDSLMDFLSTLIIYFTARAAGSSDLYHYPAGKHRMEPLGVVVFSVIMITSFSQILVESMQRLLSKDLDFAQLPPSAIVAMIVTVIVKSLIWLTYRSFQSTSIRALSQDAENDVVFNLFSLLFPFVGHYLRWVLLDPLGALLLSVYIIVEWVGTLWECTRDLVGRRADPMQHQRIIYLVTRFSPLVKAVQFCNVYSAGGGLTVEIDVLLPRDISLPKSHDICESIQYCIESLEGIQRAYVHADYKYVLVFRCGVLADIFLCASAKNPSGHHAH